MPEDVRALFPMYHPCGELVFYTRDRTTSDDMMVAGQVVYPDGTVPFDEDIIPPCSSCGEPVNVGARHRDA